MSEGELFFQAIVDAPDDDGVRSIYADWLEEQGQLPRAEFIRVQCALASPFTEDASRPALRKREIELIAAHKEEWFGSLRKKFRYWDCQRGFWDRILWTDAKVFLENADELFGSHPVQHVALDHVEQYFEDLAACPHLARLTSFTASAGYSHKRSHIRLLVESPHWKRLRVLRLPGGRFDHKTLKALAASEPLSNLTILEIGSVTNGANGIRTLAKSTTLAKLETVELRTECIPQETFEELQEELAERFEIYQPRYH